MRRSAPEADRVWIRAYSMAVKLYQSDPEAVRLCRVFAMAYTQGWNNAMKAKRRRYDRHG